MEPTHTHHHEPTHEKTVNNEPNYILPAAILITGLLIAGSLTYSKVPSAPQVVSAKDTSVLGMDRLIKPETKKVGTMNPIDSTDHIRGNPNAPLIIVEYSDPECPYCKEFHQTMLNLMSIYGSQGKLAWVYRNYPIDGLHSKARAEAQAAECAGVVGGNEKFWQFTDEVFARTGSNNTLNLSELPKIASDIGLDSRQFATCVASGQTAAKVTSDSQNAMAIGAGGTPYGIFINTKTGQSSEIPGAVPYEVMKQMIDTTLSQIH